MALKKWNANFRLGYSVRKKQNYLFRCSVAPRNFPLERPCSTFHLLSNRILRKPLVQLSHFNPLLGYSFPFPILPCLTLPRLPYHSISPLHPMPYVVSIFIQVLRYLVENGPGACFSKVPVTFRARKAVLCSRSRSKLQ